MSENFCTKCNRTFSRKYNAESHNKNIHDNLSDIMIKVRYLLPLLLPFLSITAI